MAILWVSKRSGQRAKGGGCFGCIPIPIGCVSFFLVAAALVALALP